MESTRRKPCKVPVFLASRMPNGMIHARTRASTVRDRRHGRATVVKLWHGKMQCLHLSSLIDRCNEIMWHNAAVPINCPTQINKKQNIEGQNMNVKQRPSHKNIFNRHTADWTQIYISRRYHSVDVQSGLSELDQLVKIFIVFCQISWLTMAILWLRISSYI
jgi:hypothetical protein